ncbi:MAG: cytochrome c [Granulosicoccus sp.]
MISKFLRSASEPTGAMGVSRLVRAGFLTASMAFVVGAAPVAQAEGDASAGETKAHTCLGCHGVQHYVNTYPTYHVPRIAGQHSQYLIAALQAYRAKTRSHPTMQANAALLSDQDIEDIAAWFAAQGISNK